MQIKIELEIPPEYEDRDSGLCLGFDDYLKRCIEEELKKFARKSVKDYMEKVAKEYIEEVTKEVRADMKRTVAQIRGDLEQNLKKGISSVIQTTRL